MVIAVHLIPTEVLARSQTDIRASTVSLKLCKTYQLEAVSHSPDTLVKYVT